MSTLPRRSSSHSCALHSCKRTNLHQHASAGKQGLKKMEQRGYWDVVVAALSFNVLVQVYEGRGREGARMCEEKQGKKLLNPV